MIKHHRIFLAAGLIVTLAISSCKKDKKEEEIIDYSQGTYISNEGAYGNNNASITHIAKDGTVTADAYYAANSTPLGDVLQSFNAINGRGFAVLNGTGKVEIVDLTTFKHVASINASYPRYITDAGNGKAYLTDGSMAGTVQVISLSSLSVVSSISVGNGPEQLVKSGNHMFVCNSGGSTLDNTVSVIDITTESVVQTVSVSDRPIDAVVDATGDCWVLCSGETIYDENWNITGHTDARLYRIDGTTLTVEDTQVVGANGDHPRHLAISNDGQTIYFENNGVFKFQITDGNWAGTELIADAQNSLQIHPSSGEIWTTFVPDFVSNGKARRFNASGSLIQEYNAGVGANGVYFK